jgi:hypothetical protein
VRRRERLVQLIFPNETTTYCPALAKAVTDLLGEGCLRVETLRSPQSPASWATDAANPY